MGWFSRWRKKGRSDFLSQLRSLVDVYSPEIDLISENNYRSAIQAGYQSNPIVYRSINLIANAAASVSPVLYRQDSEGKTEEITDVNNPYYRIIWRPVPYDKVLGQQMQNWATWIKNVIINYYLQGWVAIHKVLTNGNKPYKLQIYTQDDRLEFVDPDDPGRGYVVGKERKLLEFDEVLLLIADNPLKKKGIHGISPVQVSRACINLSNAARQWNLSLLQRDARPSGILSPTTVVRLEPEEIQRLKEQFTQGVRRAGEPIVQQGDIKWIPLTFAPKDTDWLAGVSMADRVTAYCLGVPSQLLGDKEAATYSNMQEARKALYTETVLPLLNYVLSGLSDFILPDDENMWYDYNPDKISALQPELDKHWQKINDSVELTLNEKRAAKGYPELPGPGGGVIVLRNGMVIDRDGNIMAFPMQGGLVSSPPPDHATNPDSDSSRSPAKSEDASPPDIYLVEVLGPPEDSREKAIWLAIENERSTALKIIREWIAAEFGADKYAIFEAIRGQETPEGLEPTIERILGARQEGWRELFEKIYGAVGAPILRSVFAQVFRRRKKASRDLPFREQILSSSFDDYWKEFVKRYVAEKCGTKIVGITETTRNDIRRELAEGISRGESIDQLAARIDKLYLEEIIPHRSEVIARTEAVSSSNLASFEGASLAGAQTKYWISTLDDRVREDHKHAHRQIRKISEPFEVGGARLMFPGDISYGAPANEVINCRCTIGYLD